MLLKRKQSAKVKAKGCAEGHYHQKFNHKLELSTHIVISCLHVCLYMTNTLNNNYKLRSVFGQKDDFTTNTWKWFDTQVRDIFLWSWMISRSLVDYTDIGRIFGCILDNVYAPSVSMKDSIRSITSYFHTSIVIHLGSNDHLRISTLILASMLSLSSKKQRNGKVSLNNGILRVDYKMTVNMLMKHLYIAVRYFYITN